MKYTNLIALLVLMGLFTFSITYSPIYGSWRYVGADGVTLTGEIHPRCRQAQRFSSFYGPCPLLLTLLGRDSSYDYGDLPESGNGVSVILYRQNQHSSPCQIYAAKNREVLTAADVSLGGRTYQRREGGMLPDFNLEVKRAGERPSGGRLDYGAHGELVAWNTWGNDVDQRWQWNEEQSQFVVPGERRYNDGLSEWIMPVVHSVLQDGEDPTAHNAAIREQAEAWRVQQVDYFSQLLGTPIPINCNDLTGWLLPREKTENTDEHAGGKTATRE